MQKILPVVILSVCFILIVNSFASEQEIKVLYKEGIVLYKSGKIEEAKEKFNAILTINPLYEPARNKLRLILDAQSRMMRRDKLIAGRERVLEVQDKWLPPPKKVVREKEKPSAIRFKTEQQRIMEEKASQIIPEINFTDARLRDVIQYLSRVSGVNIIVDEDMFVRETGEIAIPQEVEITDETGGQYIPHAISAQVGVVSDRITISLKNIPLIEALKYILSAKGLKYRIDEYAIIVSTQQRLTEVEMETRYYHLVSGIGSFTEFLESTAEEKEEALEWEEETSERKETTLTIKDVLEQSGIPFPPGSKIFLDQRTGTLIIRNTPSNLAIIEDILHILDVTPYQIEIEARFVQIDANIAKELGLEWMITSGNYRFGNDGNFRLDSDTTDLVFGRYKDPRDLTGNEGFTRGLRFMEEEDIGADKEINRLTEFSSTSAGNPVGNILSLSGVLTYPEFRMILHALNQSGDVNLVSAPKVTTVNNQRAQIKMVEELIYPGEYEVTPPTVARGRRSTTQSTATTTTSIDVGTVDLVTPGIAVPISFETRDLGIILNVTPSVGADRKTITLTLIPEITEFIDWIDYGVQEGIGWNAVPIRKPIFQTRDVTTSVVISDGETVVLGGLVKEELNTHEDKIPLLGDLPILGVLFRNKKEVSKKTNLVIFVTAKLLTPSGELVREVKEYAY